MTQALDIIVVGLSLSSSWGNGHATTYRALIKALGRRGHRVTFLERNVPWYAAHRDLAEPSYCDLVLYDGIEALAQQRQRIAKADLVILGSYVPDGIAVARFLQQTARGVLAFYDIDTPVTLTALERGDCDYLEAGLIPGFDLYLSFTGGPVLERLERDFGARAARAFYCAVDPELYAPQPASKRWDLSYLGTYSPDRQPTLERLLLEPARRLPDLRFAVAGPQYPETIDWPANVERIEHVGPADHPAFYAQSRFTLNVTRADMIAAGYSPSVRLFEAAACAIPIISDFWKGLETVLASGLEILIAGTTDAVIGYLTELSDPDAVRIGTAARDRILAGHTACHRAIALEAYVRQTMVQRAQSGPTRFWDRSIAQRRPPRETGQQGMNIQRT